MIKRTLADVKPELRRITGVAGLRVDDSRLVDYINLAQEKLLSLCKTVPGTIHRLKFAQHGGVVALPPAYARAISGSVNRVAAPIMGQWYEFLDYGPQQQDKNPQIRAEAFIDHGESPCIRTSTDKARNVRIYCSQDERVNGVVQNVTVFGYDENGQWVRSQVGGVWQDGEVLSLNGHLQNNWSTSTNKFTKVTQVVKPKTSGTVELYFYDADYDKTYLGGRYEFWETNPSLRLYYFPSISEQKDVIVHLLAKIRFKKVVNDTDVLAVGSLPALRYAMRALAKEDSDEIEAGATLWQLAKKTIDDEAREYYGNTLPLLDVKAGGPVYGAVPPVI